MEINQKRKYLTASFIGTVSDDELIGASIMNLIHPDDHELVKYKIEENRGKPYVHKGVKKDGSIIFVEVHGRDVNLGGRALRLTVLRDITDILKAEKDLIWQKTLLEATFNSISDGIVITNTDREMIMCNKGMEKTFG